MMYSYLLKCVMHQFRYMQFVLKDPSDSASPTMVHIDVDVMYGDYHNHLVPDDTRGTLAPSYQSSGYSYIQWYFKVSHPYMTPNTPKDPHRPAHLEILEEEHVMVDHVVYSLSRY